MYSFALLRFLFYAEMFVLVRQSSLNLNRRTNCCLLTEMRQAMNISYCILPKYLFWEKINYREIKPN